MPVPQLLVALSATIALGQSLSPSFRVGSAVVDVDITQDGRLLAVSMTTGLQLFDDATLTPLEAQWSHPGGPSGGMRIEKGQRR